MGSDSYLFPMSIVNVEKNKLHHAFICRSQGALLRTVKNILKYEKLD